jgi:hypothetical protein
MSSEPPYEVVVVPLLPEDAAMLDKWRGELSREAFLLALLRMCTSGAVSNPPDWTRNHAKGDRSERRFKTETVGGAV